MGRWGKGSIVVPSICCFFFFPIPFLIFFFFSFLAVQSTGYAHREVLRLLHVCHGGPPERAGDDSLAGDNYRQEEWV